MWTLATLIFPAAASAQRGPQTSNVPVLASGQLPAAAPQNEEEFTNVFTGSVSLDTYYDNNAVLSLVPGSKKQWDVGYGISPSLSFRQTRPLLAWSLTYAPGFTISQNVNYRNTFSQDFGGQFDWQLTQHNILSVQESYVRTTNPFRSLQITPGPTVSPNQTIFLPNILRQSSVTNGVFSHEFSPHTRFGLGGAFSWDHFDSTPHKGPSSALIYSQIASGEAYISHDFSAKNQIGFQYGGQVLRFPQVNARTTVHSFNVFDQIRLNPASTLTLYGGPEYALTFNQVQLNLGFALLIIPVRANQWSPVAGVILAWRSEHTGISLNYSRRISDGGGLVGAVELNIGSADINFSPTRRWTIGLNLAAADNQLLATKSSANELLTYSAGIRLSRQISRNLTFNSSFERLNETGHLSVLPVGNHNLADASITYSFMRPFGR